MGYIFRPGVTACDLGTALILLDVATDRYIALAARARDACLRLMNGVPIAAADSSIIDGLIARNFLRRVEDDAKPHFCPSAPPVLVCALDAAAAPTSAAVIGAAGRHARAILDLKVRPLNIVLADVVRWKNRLRPATHDEKYASLVAASYAHADRYVSAFNRCLPRSIAVARTMFAAGHAPDLILGVKLRPFEAHCWVQQEHVLVSDTLAAVAPFTPILIL